jgi:transposase InsO family protein
MERFGQPEVFNTDQGVQFTSAAFLDEQEGRGVRISMNSKGRFLDNIFIERLWRSLKHEEVFIKAYGSVAKARRGIGARGSRSTITSAHTRRWTIAPKRGVCASEGLWACGQRKRRCPHAHSRATEASCINITEEKERKGFNH